MEKKRVEKGEKYWCVGEDMNPLEAVCGENWALDVLRFKAGNCYTDYHECYVMCEKLRAVLNGADVIEMPPKCEIVKMANEWEINTTYASADSGSFIEGVEWLKSKIFK